MLWWKLRELKSSNWETRLKACQKLGDSKDPGAIESLVYALKDQHPQVRFAAGEALRKINPDWAKVNAARTVGPAFIEALSDPDKDVRRASAEVLGMIFERKAVDTLITLLDDPDRDVRKVVAETLSILSDRRALDPLLKTLKDPENDVRRSATYAVWQLGGSKAIPPLVEQLWDESRSVREAAAEALASLGWSPSNKEEEALYAVACKKWEQASQLGKAAVGPLTKALKDWDKEIQQAVADALGKIGDPAGVEPLLASLKHYDSEVRQTTVKALGIIRDPRAVPSLVAMAKENDSKVRRALAKALCEFQAPEVADVLVTYLTDKDREVRQAAAEGLGRIKDPQTIKPLVAALQDEDSDVRYAAGEALYALKWQPMDNYDRARYAIAIKQWDEAVYLGSTAVELLVKALSDRHTYVRSAAAYALGQIRDPQAVDLLLDLLKNSDNTVKGVAIDALGEIADPRAAKPLIRMTRDSGLASKVVGSLRRLLENNAQNVAVDDLRQIALLDNVMQNRLETDKQLADSRPTWETKQLVNCSQIKQLAKDELMRRGVFV